MKGNYRIRPLVEADFRDAVTLILDVYTGFCKDEVTPEGLKRLRYALDFDLHGPDVVYQRLKQPFMFVAESAGQVIGVISGSQDRVKQLFVAGEYHKRGIAAALLTRYESEVARSLGPNAGDIVIRVRSSLYAWRFYQQHGFKRTTGIRSYRGFSIYPMKKALLSR